MSLNLCQVRYLLIDMDGVLYRGQTALPGAAELLCFLREHDIRFQLATNNSMLTPAEFVARLVGMGMEVTEEEIMTSGVATAAYLSTLAPKGTKVCVLGEPALFEEITKRGFVIGGRDSEYVVCGADRGISFEKLKTATLAIRDGAKFIFTNADKTYPLEKDIIPGAGALLAYLVAATGVEPVVVGKPEPIMLEQSLRLLGASAAETAILGDRLETDILGGQRAGIATIMVLTGISTAEEAATYEPGPPDLLCDDLPALMATWRAALNGRG